MAIKPFHGVAGGGTGAATDNISLRLNNFNFGVGYRGYGETVNTGYYTVIDPPSTGGSGTGELGSTAGCTVYSYKSTEGPSMIVFGPGTATNVSFPAYTEYLAGVTASTVPDAIQWFMTTSVNDAVVSNRFKTVPNIESLVYYFDTNQWMCVPPNNTDYRIYGSGKDLSQNKLPWAFASVGDPVGYYGWNATDQTALPWFLDFGTDSSTKGYIDMGAGDFLKNATEFTISMWFATASTNGTTPLFTFTDTSSNSIIINLYQPVAGVAGISCDINPGGAGAVNLTGELGSVPVTWRNVVVTNSSTYGYGIYIDGILETDTTAVSITLDTVSTSYLMDTTTYTPVRFNSILIWNSGFSADDIALLYDLQSIEFTYGV